MSKYEDQIGKAGQEVAAAALRRVGVECVEKIGTPVKVIPRGIYLRQPTYQVIWGEKVSGDHHGILPGGRAVLAETKTILDRNLQWSDLREHQPEALSRYAEFGGLALLVWVHSTGVYVMQWPVPGFGPRKSISPDRARELDVNDLLVDDLTEVGYANH
jgi:hypothetical protein